MMPADDGPGFIWRLSVAELERSSPFSAFPGVERIFTLISPGPVSLAVDGQVRAVFKGEPQRFPGEAEVSVDLPEGRPEKALNLMITRGHGRGEVEVVRGITDLRLPRDCLVAVVVLTGALMLNDGRTVRALEVLLPTARARADGLPRGSLAREVESARAAGSGPVTLAAVQVFPCPAAIDSDPPAR